MLSLTELLENLLNVRNLPTISNAVVVLEQSLSQEEPDVQNVSNIISEDPVITSMVLKLGNSATYGARRTIGSVQEAVMRLGFQEVRKMVMNLALVEYMSDRQFDILDPLEFFRHSIGVATGMEQVNAMTGIVRENGHHLYVIGLLHDLGRWVSANYMTDVHQHVLPEDNPGDAEQDIIELERKNIGLDHAQIAAALLERWGLPLPVVQGVRYHHEPDAAPGAQQKISQLIYLVDNICAKNRIGEVGEGSSRELKESAYILVGLSSEAEEQIIPQINAKLEESEVVLSIGSGDSGKGR